MPARPLALVVLLVLLSPLAVRRAAAEDPAVLADRWDLMRMGDARVGHVHTVVRRVPGPDGARIETSVEEKVSLKRLGQNVDVEQGTLSVEREDGALVSVRHVSKVSAMETLVEVAIEEGSAKVRTTVMGKTREQAVPLPKPPVGPWHVDRIPVEAGLAPDAKREVAVYLPDVGPATFSVHVIGPEEVEDLDGAKRTLVRVDTRLDVIPIRSSAWQTPEGETLRARAEVMGMTFETFRTTRERALGEGEEGKGPASPDVFEASLLRTRHLVPHPRTLETALLRLKPREADSSLDVLADDRQVVERREADGTVLLRTRRVVPPAGATGTRPLAEVPKDLEPFLAPTSTLQSDDPLIRRSAEEAVGVEKDAWKAAQAIERWVYRAIGKKGFGVGFASALEVCRNREGDCSEHAVLAAALCRAAGVPSRVVMGLEYLTGIFGGHAWTEVWIAGRWYAIDATLGRGHVDPLHVTLGRFAMEEGTYGREFGKFMEAMGGLDVQVVEATWEGRRISFDDPDAVKAEGSAYVNRPWGLALRGPEGFALEPRGPAEGLSQRLVDLAGKTAGRERKLRVRAESLGVDEGLAEAVATYAGGATLEEARIDGRPARAGLVGEGAARRRVAFVVDDRDSLFAFSLEPAEDDADRALLDAFLAGVDLDAETPAKD